MSFSCEGCGREDLQNERGKYEVQICYSWGGRMICTRCRQAGIRQPTESLQKFFSTVGVRLDHNKDGSIIVPV